MPRQPNAALVVERFDAGGDSDGGEAIGAGDAAMTNGPTLEFVPLGLGTDAQAMRPDGRSIADILSRSRQLLFGKPFRRRWVAFGQRVPFGRGE